MRVEIWSDVVCPWCYIGKRRFESALAGFPHHDEVEVTWRSYQLDPGAPRKSDEDPADRVARKYGVSREQAVAMRDRITSVAAEVGLPYRLELTRPSNTLDAHRLLHLAAERGLQGALKERLLAAYFMEGQPVGDVETLVRLAVEAGLREGEARAVLESEAHIEEVRADVREAAALGITGVPFFVIDRRYGISGAQPPEMILQGLERAWADAHPVTVLTPAGDGADACTGDSCPV